MLTGRQPARVLKTVAWLDESVRWAVQVWTRLPRKAVQGQSTGQQVEPPLKMRDCQEVRCDPREGITYGSARSLHQGRPVTPAQC